MEALRGLGKFVGSLVFILALTSAIMLTALVDFTTYENIRSISFDVLSNQPAITSLDDQAISDLYDFWIIQCQSADQVTAPISNGPEVVLKCDDIRTAGKSGLKNLILNSLVSKQLNSVYYKDYGCSVIDCLRTAQQGTNPENFAVLVSSEGHEFLKTATLYAFAVAGVGLVILLASTETWPGRLQGVGWNLTFTGLPLLFLNQIVGPVTSILGSASASLVGPLVDSLLEPARGKFLVVLIAGIVLLVVGYGWKFLSSRTPSKKKRK